MRKVGPGMCDACSIRPRRSQPSKQGAPYYHRKCGTCFGRECRENRVRPMECVSCGFVAVDPCQIDTDHINGDNLDNRSENI